MSHSSVLLFAVLPSLLSKVSICEHWCWQCADPPETKMIYFYHQNQKSLVKPMTSDWWNQWLPMNQWINPIVVSPDEDKDMAWSDGGMRTMGSLLPAGQTFRQLQVKLRRVFISNTNIVIDSLSFGVKAWAEQSEERQWLHYFKSKAKQNERNRCSGISHRTM